MSKYTNAKKRRLFPIPMTEESVTRREFSYKNMTADGTNISLKFTLRVDTPEELTIFREMMVKALENIDNELAKHK